MQARELIRLPNWIQIKDAIVTPNQEYWFLKRLEYQDDTLSGGLHHIFVQEPHDITQQARVRGGSETWAVKLEKPQNEPAGNFPMFGGITYSCEMEGLPSDRVEGMHLPSKHHVNYILTYEKQRKGNLPLGGGGTDTDEDTTTTTTGQGTRTLPQVLIHRGEAAQVLEFNKNAALQKVIFRDGFVPNSPEFTLRHDNKEYLGQRAENLSSGEVRIYYCEMGDFDRVQFVKKQKRRATARRF
jgi:hypothetical protein